MNPMTSPHRDDSPSNHFYWGGVAAFLFVAAFFLWTEHRAHLLGVLPYLVFLLCPLIHFFMHPDHAGIPFTVADASDSRHVPDLGHDVCEIGSSRRAGCSGGIRSSLCTIRGGDPGILSEDLQTWGYAIVRLRTASSLRAYFTE
jgi:hypothetical protein